MPSHLKWGIIKPHKLMIVEHYESQPQTMALRPKLARSEVRGPDTLGARHANAPLDSLWAAASSMEGPPPARGPRTVLRDSQRLEPSMASSPKRRAQKRGALPSKGVRCAANLRSWSLGSWTTVICPRTGEISSNRGSVIVDHWHWTDYRGGYCVLPQGQAGMPLRGTH